MNSFSKCFRLSGVVALLLLLTDVVWAQEQSGLRLALVIGNSAYTNVTALDNPVNDATLMAKSLKQVGFTVTLITDAKHSELNRAISTFGRQLREAGEDATGLFYYAGHGVQSFGSNYLLPIDIELSDAADLSLSGVPAQAVLRQMYSARNRTNIVILDACRNNPFVNVPDLVNNGLAEMEAPRGTFLAYSTAPGETADDGGGGDGSNSTFTAALASALSIPGKPIEALFKDVRNDVLKATEGRQIPWDTSSLTIDFQFTPVKPPSPEALQMRQLWDSVKLSKDPVQVLLFLRANPDNPYTGEARSLLRELMSKETQPATVVETPKKKQPDPVAPVKSEREMIEEARKAGTAEVYQAYLDAYPKGAFSELARIELKALEDKTLEQKAASANSAADTSIPATSEAAKEPEKKVVALPDAISFSQAFQANTPEITNRSLADLIKGSPLFPPIADLPEAIWKGKTCSACHKWEQESLCVQAKTYLVDRPEAVSKRHPYGGEFKAALRIWARDGCH